LGQAKRKAAERAARENGLSPDERIVAATAGSLHARFVKPQRFSGACYQLAFFLTAYLQNEHGITVTPVVGYSNDGTGPIMASHAWIEFNGKKTDISLTETADRDALPPGPLLILDRPFTAGDTTYTYHLQPDAAAILAEQEVAADPQYGGVVEHKKREHERMAGIAKDKSRMLDYLNAAPNGCTYERLAALLKS
jgi:hypothetical protein